MKDHLLVLGFQSNLPRCANDYGNAPCTAEIGVTGEYKCFKTPASCQDPVNYVEVDDVQVIRFVKSAAYINLDVDVIPSIVDVKVSSMQLKPGFDIGQRETATITFSNHSHNGFFLDPYFAERDYEQLFNGNFWSMFDELYPNIQGFECAILRGHAGQRWDELEKTHYVIDRGNMSDDMRSFSITVRDVFMLLQNKKAQIPRPCDGFLASDIGTDLTPFTLEPPGIGDFLFPSGHRMYPTSGFAFIGEEYFSYTISGDIVTPTARGLRGTEVESHEEGDSMQVVEVFSAMTSAQIFERILSFSQIESDWYDITSWASEVEEFDTRLYSGEVSEPVEVDKVLNELISDIALTIYPDLISRKIVFEYIRKRQPVYFFNDGNIFDAKRSKDYDKRISSVYMRFGRRNPLLKMDENVNYLGRIYRLNDNLNEVLQRNSDVVHSQYSRFIPINLREAADVSTRVRLGRYSSPPRIMKFSVDKNAAPKVGKICAIQSRFLNDVRGVSDAEVLMQLTSVAVDQGRVHCIAEDYRINFEIPATDHTINVVVDQFNINLRTLHDTLYSSIESGDIVKLFIDSDIKVGSTSSGTPSLHIGDWPSGVVVEIYGGNTLTRVQGKGGNGGAGDIIPGGDGGIAIYTRYPITIYGNLKIWGGGGGSGGFTSLGLPYGGGGGAGFQPGSPAATIDDGGGGFTMMPKGGGPGQPGTNAGAGGGAAGASIDGISYVTFADSPDLRGPQIN